MSHLEELVGHGAMGVSRARGKNSSSRKQKSESGKGQEVPKPPRGKAVKQEPEETPCMVQPPAVKGKKKKSPQVEEKPLQENIISRSSLKQEAAEGKGLSSSLRDGIQAEEGAASGSEETRSILHQGSSVELKDSSGSQRKPRRAGPTAGRWLSATKAGVGVPKPSDGVAGGAASLSGESEALEMDVGLAAVREDEEKELDPPFPQQRGDARDPKRKKEREKKQEQRKQQEKGLLRKGGKKKDEFEESPGDVMEGIEEEEGEGESREAQEGENRGGGEEENKEGKNVGRGARAGEDR
ncbi:cyclic nucleotide-gated cation channel beta-1-like [Gymnogyps californianus]|uniref:cyclic nucleotide-gated cation channel beta-1-like n=1 Tax=Gymnogyps californianus TaxID=33616 RepID=UPI0021C9085B|nr:cyclic nucleotide-gated cation channel beta-1-like [Gymnogyps californianus]